MEPFHGNTPNTYSSSALSLEELDQFVAGRENYRKTPDPIRTLELGFMDEAAELIHELTAKDGEAYDREHLSEEIGDAVIMGTLIARNQNIPLSDIISASSISEFQNTLPYSEQHNWQQFGIDTMAVYANIN